MPDPLTYEEARTLTVAACYRRHIGELRLEEWKTNHVRYVSETSHLTSCLVRLAKDHGLEEEAREWLQTPPQRGDLKNE